MSKYREFRKLLDEQQKRQMAARQAAAAIGQEVTLLQVELETALIDDDTDQAEQLQHKIEAKKAEAGGHNSTVKALLKPAAELLEANRRGKIGKAAAGVVNENLQEMQELQSRYDTHREKLESLKKAYMDELKKAGEVYRASELLLTQMNEAQQYSPDHQGRSFSGITTGILRYGVGGMSQYASGTILIDPRQAEKLFFTGRE